MAILKRKEENAYEKKTSEKISVGSNNGVLLISTVPVSAASKTGYDHTMTYSIARTSAQSAYASTTCNGPNVRYVTATVKVRYKQNSRIAYKENTTSQTYATTASVNISNTDAFIDMVEGKHIASVIYRGENKTLNGTLKQYY